MIVAVRFNSVICFDNVLDIGFDKIIERVDMLLHESFDFEKGWQQIPFVLYIMSDCHPTYVSYIFP